MTALNGRARADLILNKTLNPDREVELRDGTAVGVGDTIITEGVGLVKEGMIVTPKNVTP